MTLPPLPLKDREAWLKLLALVLPGAIAYSIPRVGWVVVFPMVFYMFGVELHAGTLW